MGKIEKYQFSILFIFVAFLLVLVSSCSTQEKVEDTTTITDCPTVSPLPPDFCPEGKVIFEQCIPKCEPDKDTTVTITLPIESLEIITDANSYLQYDNEVEIKLKNNGLNSVTLTASNGCAKFFEIINLKTGKNIPLYDKNLICTQAIKEITINPGETKIIDYWDKIDYEKSFYDSYNVYRKEAVELGKYKIVVKDASKIIDIIVYTY